MNPKEKNSPKDSEGFWKTMMKRRNMALWGIGVAVLMAVAIISELSGDGGMVAVLNRSLKTVAIEIGFALLIAAFLSAGIEEKTRQRFHAEVDSRITDIQKDVFRSTFRRDLPDQFFNEVDKLLFQCKFSYLNYHIGYDFSWPQANTKTSSPHLMDVKISHIFSVRNLTAFASKHTIRLQIQELPNLSGTSCPRVVSVILRGHGNHATFEPEKIQEINNESVSDGGTRTFQIQTGEVPPGEDIQVEIRAQSTKFDDGFAFCRCSAPSNGLTVTAKFPHGIIPGRVGANSAHRTTCSSIPIDYDENKFSWVIEGAILPSQGIYFWWASDLAKTSDNKMNQ